jgi:hypothetical protein
MTLRHLGLTPYRELYVFARQFSLSCAGAVRIASGIHIACGISQGNTPSLARVANEVSTVRTSIREKSK